MPAMQLEFRFSIWMFLSSNRNKWCKHAATTNCKRFNLQNRMQLQNEKTGWHIRFPTDNGAFVCIANRSIMCLCAFCSICYFPYWFNEMELAFVLIISGWDNLCRTSSIITNSKHFEQKWLFDFVTAFVWLLFSLFDCQVIWDLNQ